MARDYLSVDGTSGTVYVSVTPLVVVVALLESKMLLELKMAAMVVPLRIPNPVTPMPTASAEVERRLVTVALPWVVLAVVPVRTKLVPGVEVATT